MLIRIKHRPRVRKAEVVNDGNTAKEIAYHPHMGRVLGGGSSVNGIDGHATTRQFAAAAPVRAERSSPSPCRAQARHTAWIFFIWRTFLPPEPG